MVNTSALRIRHVHQGFNLLGRRTSGSGSRQGRRDERAIEGSAMMNLHKLSAGNGYTYLTRQVAANDAADTGYANLGEYYSERGESPGVWLGRGLAGLG